MMSTPILLRIAIYEITRRLEELSKQAIAQQSPAAAPQGNPPAQKKRNLPELDGAAAQKYLKET